MQIRALDEFISPAEVGDDLADGDSVGVTVEDDRIVQHPGGDPAVVFGVGSSKTS